MGNLLLWSGRLLGLIGFLICAAAVVARVMGIWKLGGFQVGTLLQGGTAVAILACLAYCADFAERARTSRAAP